MREDLSHLLLNCNFAKGVDIQHSTKEFYVITTALAKFRHYLFGHKFILRTDQNNLKSLIDHSLQTHE